MTKQAHWTKGRKSLINALDQERPISFCWQVLQHIASLYAQENKIPFLALPTCERQAMRDWLISL